MSLARLTTEISPIRARAFFEDVCPAALSTRAELCRSVGGRFAFSLEGEGGGAWVIDVANARVFAGAGEEAEVRIAMAATDFDAFLRGTLDVVAAANAGRIRIEGQSRLLSGLVAILRPSVA